jgi:N-acyl-D-amino-acid deacylase
MEALDAHGGWIASAADLVRFTMAVDGQRGSALLSPAALQTMITTPRPKESGIGSGWDMKPVTAGLGWDTKPVPGGVEWSHGGALAGSSAAWPFHGPDELTMAYVFNSLPVEFREFFLEAGTAILTAASAVQTWPTHDLFSEDAPWVRRARKAFPAHLLPTGRRLPGGRPVTALHLHVAHGEIRRPPPSPEKRI